MTDVLEASPTTNVDISSPLTRLGSYLPPPQQDNLAATLNFNKSLSPNREQEKETILQEIRSVRNRDVDDYIAGQNLERRMLNETEQQTVEELLGIAKDKLVELGIEDAEKRLPSMDQLVFANYKKGTENLIESGETSVYGNFVAIKLSETTPLDSLEGQRAFFHELSHAVTKKTIMTERYAEDKPTSSTDSYAQASLGFNRYSQKFDTVNKIPWAKGIFEEPLTELFTMYCLQDSQFANVAEGIQLRTPYNKQLSFMLAFIDKFAASDEPQAKFEAFKQLFVAKTNRDFSLYPQLVQTFTKEGMRLMNNIETQSSKLKKGEVYNEATKACGIDKEVNSYTMSFMIDGSVEVPWLNGSFSSLPPP